eukprot:6119056-Pleurochrysis_carterae.AAC.1
MEVCERGRKERTSAWVGRAGEGWGRVTCVGHHGAVGAHAKRRGLRWRGDGVHRAVCEGGGGGGGGGLRGGI